MKYSRPIKAILDREMARLEGKRYDGPSRVVGEIGRVHGAVQSLEAVALNRNPADNDAMHMKKTHDAGVKLAKAVEATRQRANEILNMHSDRLRNAILDRTGLRPPETWSDIMRQSEFRAVVRTLNDEQRSDILREAVKSKNSEVLSAFFKADFAQRQITDLSTYILCADAEAPLSDVGPYAIDGLDCNTAMAFLTRFPAVRPKGQNTASTCPYLERNKVVSRKWWKFSGVVLRAV